MIEKSNDTMIALLGYITGNCFFLDEMIHE